MKKHIFALSLVLAAFTSCQKDISKVDIADDQTISTVKGDTIVHKLMVDGHQTFVNEIKGKFYFSEDITLTTDQFNMLKHLSNKELSTIERSTFIQSFSQTWPKGIVYYVKPGLEIASNSEVAKQYLRNLETAMNMISSTTPIRFVERTSETEYLRFVTSNGNSSPLGWSKNRVNTINLYNWNMPGIIAHEILHSLGVHHEQCRPDRDEHVEIHLDRVPSGYEHNFNIAPGFAAHGNFDFGSVMMYDPYSFTTTGAPTITALDGSTYRTQREGLSAGDIAGLNHLYAPVNFDSVAEGIYRIENVLDDKKSLDIENGRIANGSRIILWGSHNGNNQKFIFRRSANPGFIIIKSATDTTKVLTVRGESSSTGTLVELNTLSNSDAQQWRLHNLGNKGFSFEPRNAYGLRLELNNGSTANLTPMVIGRQDNSDKQRFVVDKLN